MAKGENQKLKLLYLMQFLLEKTDDKHGASMEEILTYLANNEISAERKSIYSDMEELRRFGIDVEKRKKEKYTYYHVISRKFELAELKLLVDAIQSSKFLTAKKSNELIKKIEGLASIYQAKELQRQVILSDRVKSMNESTYYNVDSIHSAINKNSKIMFKYFSWNAKKQKEYKREGGQYTASPWVLCWDNENYYLIAYDEKDEKIKHFRVDKMDDICLTYSKRDGKDKLDDNIARYSNKTFSMYAGENENVRIRFSNKLAGVVVDRFGQDIIFHKDDMEDCFSVFVDISVSNQFFGWITGLGSDVKLLGPDNVVENYKNYLKDIYEKYE